ncbi:MAG: twin-arginine translocation signal domain-containing protein [Scytonema sp. PMC 1069.18]|nr:twin-arginine translocation signal domain-containing protein [Scytonema sp. PMC 1069.18]MEC4882195.1 twin-arginine translocation signal domain-containing protein [Scytonema sp. PMC 1070.18]
MSKSDNKKGVWRGFSRRGFLKGTAIGAAPYYEPINVLLDDQFYDTFFGQQAYKCFACRVRKA